MSNKTNIMSHFKLDLSLNPSPISTPVRLKLRVLSPKGERNRKWCFERNFAGYEIESYKTLFRSIYLSIQQTN